LWVPAADVAVGAAAAVAVDEGSGAAELLPQASHPVNPKAVRERQRDREERREGE
jgi:hypothetical protein